MSTTATAEIKHGVVISDEELRRQGIVQFGTADDYVINHGQRKANVGVYRSGSRSCDRITKIAVAFTKIFGAYVAPYFTNPAHEDQGYIRFRLEYEAAKRVVGLFNERHAGLDLEVEGGNLPYCRIIVSKDITGLDDVGIIAEAYRTYVAVIEGREFSDALRNLKSVLDSVFRVFSSGIN